MMRAMLERLAVVTMVSTCTAFAGLADTITMSPRVIPVGKWAEGIVYDGRSLWVAESGQRSIAQLDLDKGTVARRIQVGRFPVGMVIGSDNSVDVLVETDKLVWQQPPGAGRAKTLAGLEGCPQAIGAAGQYLWVLTWPDCSSNTGRVIRIDPQGRRASTGMLDEMSQAVVAAGDKLWVAHSRGRALSVVDAQSLSVRKADVQGAALWAITAATERNIYVGGGLGESQGIVASIDPVTLQELHRQVVDQRIAFMTDDDRSVVAVGEKGTIFVFSVDGLELQRVINLSAKLDPRSILILGEDLYLSSGQQVGEYGAVMSLTGWRPASAAPPPQAAPAPSGPTDCPYGVADADAASPLWLYQDPDTDAPKVVGVPPDAKGLVADRCIKEWCHVAFRGATGWIEKSHIKAYCN